MVKVVLPELGEGVTKATVSYWHFQLNDAVKKDQDLVELATDKAVFNLPCPATGKLVEILCEEGRTVKVGEVLGAIEEG